MPFRPTLIDAQWADPTTVSASGSWTSAVIRNHMHFDRVSLGLTSTQAGQVTFTRYADGAGQTLIDSHPATLTASTPASLSIVDNVPFESFTVTITNTGTSIATISHFNGLLRGPDLI